MYECFFWVMCLDVTMIDTMLVTNPFAVFSPKRARFMILGSFAAKDGKSGMEYDWYYSNGRNQFWPILEKVYGEKLRDKKSQQDLFRRLSMAVADIIYRCERKGNSSLDVNLANCVYNIKPIRQVLLKHPIEKIFFTSRFVEKEYKRHLRELVEEFPAIELITLPSPSPRYAAMRKEEKIKIYTQLLPKMMFE